MSGPSEVTQGDLFTVAAIVVTALGVYFSNRNNRENRDTIDDRTNKVATWEKLNALDKEFRDYKTLVSEKYIKKEYVDERTDHKFALIMQEITTIKNDVEQIQSQVSGINEIGPQLMLTMDRINEKLGK